MSYQVLARKYRSQTFDEVVGQDHVAQTLKRAIDSARVAHAFLFCGTRGTGKTSMARILAKALNCQKSKGPTAEPCGKCESCLAVARGDDMDVIEIDAASNTKVEDTRDVILDHTAYRPARGRFKIFIIDEVHMLSKSSFNALLKTLEEPPEHVKFILATTEPEKVLPTILSRCQRYDFRNISTREIAEHLRQICKQEKIKADEEALLLIAKAGCGSMRDALSLLDRLLSVGEKQLTPELIEQMLGMPRSQVLFELLQSIGRGDVKRLLELADAQVKGGMSPDTLVGGLIDHLRNLLILRTCGPDSELVEVPGVAMEELFSQANLFDAVTLSQDIAILEELRRSLRTSGAGRALLDATLVRLALAGQFTSVDELLNRVNGGATTSAAASRAPAPKKNDEVNARVVEAVSPSPCTQGEGRGEGAFQADSSQLTADSYRKNPCPRPLPEYRERESESNLAAVSPTDLDGIWRMLLQMLAAKSTATAALLGGAKMVGIEDGFAIVRFAHDHEAIVRRFESNGKKDAIKEILAQLLNQNVGVKFELEPAPAPPEPQNGGNAAQREPRAVAMRRSALPAAESAASPAPSRVTPEMKEALRADPLVAAVMQHLGGEIVKVE